MSESGLFVMPAGAFCDVPRCGKPATQAVIATQNPGHVYLCDSHHKAVIQEVMRLPDARHDPWAENKRQP